VHLQDNAAHRTVIEGKEEAAAKFRDYFAYDEAIKDIPSHRGLALFRGSNESMLKLVMKLPEEMMPVESGPASFNSCELKIAARFRISDTKQPADKWLLNAVRFAWQAKLAAQFESELLTALRQRCEEEAIRVFARNLQDLMLAAPAGPRATMDWTQACARGSKWPSSTGRGNSSTPPRCIRTCHAMTGTAPLRRSRCSPQAQRRSHQHRQWYGLALKRTSWRRADQKAPRSQAQKIGRVRGGSIGLLRF